MLVERTMKYYFYIIAVFAFLFFFGPSWSSTLANQTDANDDPKNSPEKHFVDKAIAVHPHQLFYIEDEDLKQVRPIAQEVTEKIDEIARKAYEYYTAISETGGKKSIKQEGFYGPVYLIQCPGNQQLYIFTLYWLGLESSSHLQYHFIMFDPNSAAVTQEPFAVSGKWFNSAKLQGLLLAPMIHFFDINQDGSVEVVIQQIVRNGTMYNAAIYHYFHIDENMSFIRLLALESRVVDLFSDEKGMILRRVSRLKQNEIKISASLQIPQGAPSEEDIGYVKLVSKGNSSPFQVVKKHVDLERYRGVLITASGRDDDYFIREGTWSPSDF